MELVPENLGGSVVFNVQSSCGANKAICGNCGDFAIAVHNWVMNTDIKYVVVDLQDEKEICPAFLEELLQLGKRLRFPFVFAGVMDKPQRVLESYNYGNRASTFVTPQEALAYLEELQPGITKTSLEGLEFGTPIAVSRPRGGLVAVEAEAEAEAVD